MSAIFGEILRYGQSGEGDGVKSSGIGSYCLMGSGNHLNFGCTPAPVCAYLHDLAGWCDNQFLLNSPALLDAQHGDYLTVMKYQSSRPNEYFVVENRSKLGLDQFLPSSGLAIYHCDTMGSNEFQDGTAQRHYQCALLQADGHRDLETNANQGDGTDLFSAIAGVAVSNLTNPSSRWWDGADSGLVISGIEVPDAKIGFCVGAASATLGIRGENNTAVPIPDNAPAGIASTIRIAEAGVVKQFKVNVDITHPYIGDLRLELVSPSGRSVVLHSQLGGSQHNLVVNYDSAAPLSPPSALVGQSMQGNWTLRVADLAAVDIGTLNKWSLELLPAG